MTSDRTCHRSPPHHRSQERKLPKSQALVAGPLPRAGAKAPAAREHTDGRESGVGPARASPGGRAAAIRAPAFRAQDGTGRVAGCGARSRSRAAGHRGTGHQRRALDPLRLRWEGYTRFLDDPLLPLDNNLAERLLRTVVLCRKNSGFIGADWTAACAALLWSVLHTAKRNGLNPLTYLTAYFQACAEHGGLPLSGPELARFLPWALSPTDKATWSAPLPVAAWLPPPAGAWPSLGARADAVRAAGGTCIRPTARWRALRPIGPGSPPPAPRTDHDAHEPGLPDHVAAHGQRT